MKTINLKRVNWRKNAKATDFDPDDQELAQTPHDVVALLGFDPKTGADAAVKASDPGGADEPSANDAHAGDTIMRSAQLVGVGNWLKDACNAKLDGLKSALVEEVKEIKPTADKTDKLFSNAAHLIHVTFVNVQTLLKESLSAVATTIGESHSHSLAVNHGVTAAPKELDPDELKVLGLTISETCDKFAADLLTRFKAQMRIGLDHGEGPEELAERIEGTKDEVKASEIMAGLEKLGIVRAGALDIAFTSILDPTTNSFSSLIVNAIASAAHDVEQGLFDDLDDDQKENLGTQWNCSMENTCDQCLVFEGAQWDADMNPVPDDGPPYPGDPPESQHPRCACKCITVNLDEDAAQPKKADEYFKDQSPDVLAASFGKAPARAFLDGKISGKELLDSGFKLPPKEFADLSAKFKSLGITK